MDYEKFIEKTKQSRLANPLKSGGYKLQEAFDFISSADKQIACIGALQPRKAARHKDTPENWHIWLKQLPKNLLESIYRDIFPAIEALGGDGVPASHTEHIRTVYVPMLEAIVSDIKALPKINATSTRTAIRDDSSDLKRIVVTLRDILENVLNEVARYWGLQSL